jgi:hypothetical protein
MKSSTIREPLPYLAEPVTLRCRDLAILYEYGSRSSRRWFYGGMAMQSP